MMVRPRDQAKRCITESTWISVDGAATNSSTLEDRTATFTQTAAGALAAEVASWLRTIWDGGDV